MINDVIRKAEWIICGPVKLLLSIHGTCVPCSSTDPDHAVVKEILFKSCIVTPLDYELT